MDPIDREDPFLVPLPPRREAPRDAPGGGCSYEILRALPGFHIGLSAVLHLGVLAASALIRLPGEELEYGLTRDQQQLISRILATADAQEIAPREAELAESGEGNEGGTCTRTRCEEGTIGNPSTSRSSDPSVVERSGCPSDAARAAALRDAAEFAVTTVRASPGEWGSPWTQNEAPVYDVPCARCHSWGEAPDPFLAAARPRLSGIGDDDRDPRGVDLGLGLGSIGVLGPAARTAPRFGSGAAPFLGSTRLRRPQIRTGAASVSGRLPAEVIQRILRHHLGRLRLCYENGLRDNPELQGRIAVRFVIGRDGSVSGATNAGADMADGGVLACVVRAHYSLSFPQPESGIVTVVFPIVFSPGE